MAAFTTARELFELAIQAERTAETAYRRLAQLFAHHAEVAAFWERYAVQEAQHAAWLMQIRDKVSPIELEAPEDPVMVEGLQRAASVSVEEVLVGVETLDDAYMLVSDLENSETNVVFEFLADRYAQDAGTQRFLRAQLRDHVGDLMVDFPARFGTASVRRRIRAVHA